MASSDSYYEILGVERTASPEQIRAAYLKLVGEYHPDRHQDNPLKDLAAQKLASVNEAYQTLSNAQLRAAYDAKMGGAFFSARTNSQHGPLSGLSTHAQRWLMTILLVLAIPLLLRFGQPLLRLLLRAIGLLFRFL